MMLSILQHSTHCRLMDSAPRIQMLGMENMQAEEQEQFQV